MKVAIIGAGAAGFFTAINLKKTIPEADITIFEAGSRVLNKVRLSGGGRCNLTNSFEEITNLAQAYPRGDKLMKRLFNVFNHEDCYEWFESKGVKLTTQADQCVFPVSQSSEEIIDTLLSEAEELGVKLELKCAVVDIKADSEFELYFDNRFGEHDVVNTDILVITTGGSPRKDSYGFMSNLPIELIEPAPSLFPLIVDDQSLNSLSGAVCPNAILGIQGTKIKASGALLVTHFGLSGPAGLKLSSYAAKELKESGYKAPIYINWSGESNEEIVREGLKKIIKEEGKKLVGSYRPFDLTTRIWHHIIDKLEVPDDKRWNELSSKGISAIVQGLIYDKYEIAGRSMHKDEFVTCGGVSLKSINMSTLEAKNCKNLYFAGEVLDIDAITGGFNLQAAWTTGYCAAQSIIKQQA